MKLQLCLSWTGKVSNILGGVGLVKNLKQCFPIVNINKKDILHNLFPDMFHYILSHLGLPQYQFYHQNNQLPLCQMKLYLPISRAADWLKGSCVSHITLIVNSGHDVNRQTTFHIGRTNKKNVCLLKFAKMAATGHHCVNRKTCWCFF